MDGPVDRRGFLALTALAAGAAAACRVGGPAPPCNRR
ncbi:twin-arginine translocation signal domain-containing protein [Saccharothrix texasensis]|nr:twin-arginine translocation signal domain-containing protein [Saccharothrix texasensis]